MSAPFGGHPTLATYIDWLRREQGGTAQSGVATDANGQSHGLTRLSLPNGQRVVVVGVSQTEHLAPTMIGYLDRRLGIKSPWFSL